MVQLFRSGLPLRRIGLVYEVTRQRVQQILREALGPDYEKVLREHVERRPPRRRASRSEAAARA
jgi:DNA-directed RNA polymerase sigma subunit (sigma70/sigma32)